MIKWKNLFVNKSHKGKDIIKELKEPQEHNWIFIANTLQLMVICTFLSILCLMSSLLEKVI